MRGNGQEKVAICVCCMYQEVVGNHEWFGCADLLFQQLGTWYRRRSKISGTIECQISWHRWLSEILPTSKGRLNCCQMLRSPTLILQEHFRPIRNSVLRRLILLRSNILQPCPWYCRTFCAIMDAYGAWSINFNQKSLESLQAFFHSLCAGLPCTWSTFFCSKALELFSNGGVHLYLAYIS